jgi:Trypsin-co-occurring domain 2
MPSNSSEIGLAEFIHSLRAELAEAVDRAAGERLQLQATKLDLELQLTAEKSGGPNAKVEFKVLGFVGGSLGGQAQLTSKTIHTVKLSLMPILDGRVGPISLFQGHHESLSDLRPFIISPERSRTLAKPKRPKSATRVKIKR